MKSETYDDGQSAAMNCSASETPQTDAIFRHIALANHPETDGEHFRAFMESARNGIETLERERDTLRNAIRDAVSAFERIRWGYDGPCGSLDIMVLLEDVISQNAGVLAHADEKTN